MRGKVSGLTAVIMFVCFIGTGRVAGGDYLVVEDFNSYADIDELKMVWKDGFVNGTGSSILLEADALYVRDGNSMKFYYWNDDAGFGYYSEVEAETGDLGIPRDWPAEGYGELSLWFCGREDNGAARMYVALEDGAGVIDVVPYAGDMNDVRIEQWQQWKVGLEEFGVVDLTDVNKIYIGFGDRGNPQPDGVGRVWFEDIMLETADEVEVAMKLTPQMLNCGSEGNWVKAHFLLPEGYLPEDVDINSPATAEPVGVESEYIKVYDNCSNCYEVVAVFDREAFCEALGEVDKNQLEVTITGVFTSGERFVGTDTISLKSDRWRHRHRNKK